MWLSLPVSPSLSVSLSYSLVSFPPTSCLSLSFSDSLAASLLFVSFY